ncbi:MarR family transcriptional regulator [Kocuria rhizophila]|uniref:MarR family winged helix-turn-helix transcriptional regulator n=1 Tax=Kocuria rhizophila TaxID=72000 RepID=UPI000EF25E3D|nr:MarR family transcriptional regulator [Kocuria rhizophila]RLP59222.1 MarR family transcriptional regulator [Kocuria rhizophila]
MTENGAGFLPAGPHSRALRRVITLNQEIGHQLRRIMGLKDTDYSAMALLMRRPMGPTELARALHITTASATAMVDRLVLAGHVVREPHHEDRRRMTVRALQPSTEEVAAQVAPMIGMVEEELAALDEAGRRAVLQFLTGTAARMEDHLEQLRERPARAGHCESFAAGRAEGTS